MTPLSPSCLWTFCCLGVRASWSHGFLAQILWGLFAFFFFSFLYAFMLLALLLHLVVFLFVIRGKKAVYILTFLFLSFFLFFFFFFFFFFWPHPWHGEVPRLGVERETRVAATSLRHSHSNTASGTEDLNRHLSKEDIHMVKGTWKDAPHHWLLEKHKLKLQ